MATSGSYNYKATSDEVCRRALRIVGALGQGETPDTTTYTETREALNALIKEWQADGMQLWRIQTNSITLVAGTASYTIGIGGTVAVAPPLKVINAYIRTTSTSIDTPLLLITRNQYEMYGDKATQSTPNQVWYDPPGNLSGGEMLGTVYVYPAPDSTTASTQTIRLVGVAALQDLDAGADDIDFPSYFTNALVWGLADQLAYEHGQSPVIMDRITKKAMYHKDIALSFGTEEGSLFFQPQQLNG
jgi:hypothetical protein